MVKSAQDYSLNAEYIKRASEVVNKALHLSHLASAKEEDRDAIFPLVDSGAAIRAVFPIEKTAAMVVEDNVMPNLFLLAERDIVLEESAGHIKEAEAFISYDRFADRRKLRDRSSLLASMEQELKKSAADFTRYEIEYREAIEKAARWVDVNLTKIAKVSNFFLADFPDGGDILRDVFDKCKMPRISAHVEEDKFIKSAAAASCEPYADEKDKKFLELVKSAYHATCRAEEIEESLLTLEESWPPFLGPSAELTPRRPSLSKEAAVPPTSDPDAGSGRSFSLSRALPWRRGYENVKSLGLWPIGTAEYIGERATTKERLETEIANLIPQVHDPDTEEELLKVRALTKLTDFMLTDPIISEYDPDDVVKAFNEVLEAAPDIMDSTALLRGAVRKSLQAEGLEPFELKEISDAAERSSRSSETQLVPGLVRAQDIAGMSMAEYDEARAQAKREAGEFKLKIRAVAVQEAKDKREAVRHGREEGKPGEEGEAAKRFKLEMNKAELAADKAKREQQMHAPLLERARQAPGIDRAKLRLDILGAAKDDTDGLLKVRRSVRGTGANLYTPRMAYNAFMKK